MTFADIVILSMIAVGVLYSIYRMIKNRQSDGCAGCSQHGQPKWIHDYKRKLK